MATVLAALDNSLAANPVLVMARSLARVLGAQVAAVHVLGDGPAPAEDATGAAGIPLRTFSGPVVPRLVEAALDPDVEAVVVGARGAGKTQNPLGSTALAVVTALTKPVVVVPPGVHVPPQIRRVFVPLQGDSSSSLTPLSGLALRPGAIVEVIAQDVGEGAEELVSSAVQESGADLVAIGWTHALSPVRTPLVRAALEDGSAPVMLIPVVERSTAGAAEKA